MTIGERRNIDELTICRAANGFVVFDQRSRAEIGMRTDFVNGTYVAETPVELADLVRRLVTGETP